MITTYIESETHRYNQNIFCALDTLLGSTLRAYYTRVFFDDGSKLPSADAITSSKLWVIASHYCTASTPRTAKFKYRDRCIDIIQGSCLYHALTMILRSDIKHKTENVRQAGGYSMVFSN